MGVNRRSEVWLGFLFIVSYLFVLHHTYRNIHPILLFFFLHQQASQIHLILLFFFLHQPASHIHLTLLSFFLHQQASHIHLILLSLFRHQQASHVHFHPPILVPPPTLLPISSSFSTNLRHLLLLV